MVPGSALAAPKKKAAPKAKAKIAVSLKKKAPARAPASTKKAKNAPSKKTSPKAIAKKGAPQKPIKGKAPSKAQAKTVPAKRPAPTFDSAPRERLPTGMAGLGLGSAAGSMNSNKNFEIRGQARTLSMMLILRNGKENVNFVKVRQDYATEIAKTEF
jgi:hypothetical protein